MLGIYISMSYIFSRGSVCAADFDLRPAQYLADAGARAFPRERERDRSVEATPRLHCHTAAVDRRDDYICALMRRRQSDDAYICSQTRRSLRSRAETVYNSREVVVWLQLLGRGGGRRRFFSGAASRETQWREPTDMMLLYRKLLEWPF